MRTFVDEGGKEWEVREINVPALAVVPRRLLPHPEYAEGWLLFSCGEERRRIAPFPADWLSLPTLVLAQCWATAQPVRAPRPFPFANGAPRTEKQLLD